MATLHEAGPQACDRQDGQAASAVGAGTKADIDASCLGFDPAKPGNVAGCWIDANVVRLGHWRGADATNRIDTWARYPDGNYGRGVQYPFMHLKSRAYVAA